MAELTTFEVDGPTSGVLLSAMLYDLTCVSSEDPLTVAVGNGILTGKKLPTMPLTSSLEPNLS